MLKIIALILVTISASANETVTSYVEPDGHESRSSRIYLEAHAGPSIGTGSWSSMNGVPSTQSSTKFSGGFGLQSAFNDIFYFQTELNYVQRGFNSPIGIGGYSSDHNFSYLEIPLLLKAKAVTGSALRPYVMAGPSIGVLTSSAVTFNEFNTIYEVSSSANQFETFNISAVFGGGVSFELNDKSNFFLDGRYSHGLTNVLKSSTFSDVSADTMKLHLVQVMTGLQFGL